jgi:hypothetical protein
MAVTERFAKIKKPLQTTVALSIYASTFDLYEVVALYACEV